EALRRRATVGAFPPPVQLLLGEMAAAGTLMRSGIKFDGSLVLQLKGDGPVTLAVAEISPGLSFRATAQVTEDVAADVTLAGLVNVGGGGRCAITLDPRDRPAGKLPYQGIVPLSDDSGVAMTRLADALEYYMLQSEQLATRFVLAANDEVAAGLMLQRMPAGEGDTHDPYARHEDFERITMLGQSLTRNELLTLDADTILRRLFWQETVLRYAPQAVGFRCSCSRERVRGMLLALGQCEVEDIIAEQGRVEVGCDFCGEQYHFDAVDVGGMFADGSLHADAPETLQ
ncbi:MAG: Hsp33 family molecular chaperone HslO, partial [Gammaproteobacteria bacterium]